MLTSRFNAPVFCRVCSDVYILPDATTVRVLSITLLWVFFSMVNFLFGLRSMSVDDSPDSSMYTNRLPLARQPFLQANEILDELSNFIYVSKSVIRVSF